MSIASENLMRLAGTGYGGGNAPDPYGIYGALLAQGQTGLDTKRYQDESGRADRELNELINERKRRYQLDLMGKGFGTSSELRKVGAEVGLTPTDITFGGPANIGDVEKAVGIYGALEPYSYKMKNAQINPLYDPNKANIAQILSRQLARYGQR